MPFNSDLLEFHKSCKEEFLKILDTFNLLLYGFGCKKSLLEEMYPDFLQFNMKYSTVNDVVEDLILESELNLSKGTLQEIDMQLFEEEKKITLILHNFDFNSEFLNLRAIRLIGTLENINFNFQMSDIADFNFIFRDFTTFCDYTEETLEIDLSFNTIKNVQSISRNLSPKSNFIFYELLKLGNCSLTNLFESVKMPLMITKSTLIIELLHEFIDHNVIKIIDNSIYIQLSKDEINELLELLELQTEK